MATNSTATRFIERHGLWTEEQTEKAAEIRARISEEGLTHIRLGWGDQHGIIRGKTITIAEFHSALEGGKDFQTAPMIFDTTNNPVISPFSTGAGFGIEEMTGLPDGVLVPDPLTFHVLPWVESTGWILSDMYFNSGNPVPFSTRGILRKQIENASTMGYDYITGLELEFYITKLEDPKLDPDDCGHPPAPPTVSAIAHGFQYLTESRGDEIDGILRVLQSSLEALGLPLLTIEDEWGPGQVEFTFSPAPGLESADNTLLFRSAIKQICRRQGYHATFMSRPGLPNFFSSGWHLHQTLVDGEGRNVFADEEQSISDLALNYAGGLLENARATSILTTPTINGYKRFRPDSFAPDNACWAFENRGAMVRVIGAPGDSSSRLENRIGEPTANPYLYLASQLIAGLDGIERGVEAGPSSDEPYLSDRPKLPTSLMEALPAFGESDLLRRELGEEFIEYFTAIKRSEVERFLGAVTDWEQREYFEMY